MAKSTTPTDWDAPPQITPVTLKNQSDGWYPALHPAQLDAFNCASKYVVLHGEKGTGKGISALNALVRHCYQNKNALAIIIALSIRVGKEGVLYDLENLVLPAWRDGNRYPELLNGVKHPKAGELMDSGIGLQFTASRQDPDTKDRVIWIANRHGGWSKVLLVSVPYAEAVEARIKGPAPSFVYLEEATNMESDEYFKYPAAQMGRRRDIEDPMQLYASCNPTGPSSWVYQTWWINCVDPETGLRDPDFAVFHIPIAENIDYLPAGYVARLMQLFKDPIERRRLIDGEWVDRPSGESIFKLFFFPEIHVKGDSLKDIGVKPFPGFPIIVGYDPGPVNFCVAMLQRIITKERTFWLLFDELNFVGKYTPYRRVIATLLKRFDYWNALLDTEFKYVHIADEAAFNQIKSDGSYDSTEIQKLSGGRIKLRACPKARDSVRERYQMLISMWLEEEYYLSATCRKSIEAIRLVSSKKVKVGEYDANAGLTPVRSVHIHPIDAMTYAILYFQLQPSKFANVQTTQIEPISYAAGRG
jgi:hypothetical protein